MADNAWSVFCKTDGERYVRGLLQVKAENDLAQNMKGTVVRRVSEAFEGHMIHALVSVMRTWFAHFW